jgi:hypothetical protein
VLAHPDVLQVNPRRRPAPFFRASLASRKNRNAYHVRLVITHRDTITRCYYKTLNLKLFLQSDEIVALTVAPKKICAFLPTRS